MNVRPSPSTGLFTVSHLSSAISTTHQGRGIIFSDPLDQTWSRDDRERFILIPISLSCVHHIDFLWCSKLFRTLCKAPASLKDKVDDNDDHPSGGCGEFNDDDDDDAGSLRLCVPLPFVMHLQNRICVRPK